MYHSLIFKDGNTVRNTWDDWHLIPSSRPVPERPEIQYKYVDIPGRNGQLDLTDYLTAKPTMKDITGTFTFYVANDYGDWPSRKLEIAQFLDGRKMQMYLEDDPIYYYRGRFALKKWNPGGNWSEVVIEYHIDPYKYIDEERKFVT